MSASFDSNFTSAITLAGTGTTLAGTPYAVSTLSFYNQISTCNDVTNCSMKLPLNPILSQQYYFKNDDSAPAFIFPGNAQSQIDSLGAGVQFRLAGGSQCVLVPASNTFASPPVVQWHHLDQYGQPSVLAGITALAGAGSQFGVQANSVAPPKGVQTYVVSTVATSGDSIALPRTTAIVWNQPILICNLGVASMIVYPSNTAADNSLINNFLANIPAWIGPGASAYFMPVSVAAGVVQWITYGYSGPKAVAIFAATPQNITRGMSGHVVQINVATGTWTLPVVAGSQGCQYKIVNGTTGAGSTQIINAAAGTPVFGVAIGGTNAQLTSRAGAGTLSVRFGASSAEGDSIDLICDGTHWQAQALSSSNTAATSVLFA